METTKYENKVDKGIDDILSPKAKKVEDKESRSEKKPPEVVEIIVATANNGIEKGETKKVLLNSAATQHMITNGYWKVNE